MFSIVKPSPCLAELRERERAEGLAAGRGAIHTPLGIFQTPMKYDVVYFIRISTNILLASEICHISDANGAYPYKIYYAASEWHHGPRRGRPAAWPAPPGRSSPRRRPRAARCGRGRVMMRSRSVPYVGIVHDSPPAPWCNPSTDSSSTCTTLYWKNVTFKGTYPLSLTSAEPSSSAGISAKATAF